MTKLVAKVLIFYFDNEEPLLLVLTRSSYSSAPGLGDLPGGKIESDESVEQGAKREVQEETGLILKTISPLTVHELQHPSGITKIEYLFYAVVDTQEISVNPQEHSSFKWIALEEIEQSQIHPLTLKAILSKQQHFAKLLYDEVQGAT